MPHSSCKRARNRATAKKKVGVPNAKKKFSGDPKERKREWVLIRLDFYSRINVKLRDYVNLQI